MSTQRTYNQNAKVKCIHCKSDNYTKQGYRKTRNRGKIQKYYCRDCGKYFTNDEGFYRVHNSPQKITLCLDLFYRGISTRKIQEHLQAFYPHNSTYVTIYKWIVKYSKMIGRYTDRLKLQVGQEIQMDEMEYKTNGKQSWFIDAIDTKTRYMVSSEYVKSRVRNNIKKILIDTQYKTGEQVKIVTTDAHIIYKNIVKKVYGYNQKSRRYNIIHNVVNAKQGGGFNHKIERLHNSIRARTKTFRGFHGSINSANALMKGYEVYYNFIRKHQAIGKCPYELALPELKLWGNNKWLELIKLSS